MAINMMCMNSRCKHYWEDNCMRNLNEERIEINENGVCETFEEGVNECYELEKQYTSREVIENFIKKHGYTYTVEDILESYQKYWINNYYTSYTMTHCIENLQVEIMNLLIEQSE